MRNIILHRNGELDTQDIIDFPNLSEWEGETVPFSKIRFENYYHAIINILVSIILEGGKKLKN